MSVEIHETAIVDPGAKLAAGVVVGPYAVVGAEVVIGARTEIGAGAKITGPTRMGVENKVFSHACIGFDPQDLKFQGEKTRLEIGDRNDEDAVVYPDIDMQLTSPNEGQEFQHRDGRPYRT